MAVLKQLGKYKVVEVIGKGAMGIVYKGYDPDLERHVALKTVRKELVDEKLAEQIIARFKNEALASGRRIRNRLLDSGRRAGIRP